MAPFSVFLFVFFTQLHGVCCRKIVKHRQNHFLTLILRGGLKNVVLIEVNGTNFVVNSKLVTKMSQTVKIQWMWSEFQNSKIYPSSPNDMAEE